MYNLVYESSARADFRALFQDQKGQVPSDSSSLVYALSAELRGHWVATVIDAQPDQVRVLYELHDGSLRVTVNGQDQAAQAEKARAELARGVVAEMSADGGVLAVYVNSQADKFSRDLALSLFGVSEFVLAPGGESESWQTHEQDRSGSYLARYQIVAAPQKDASASTGTLIRKTKLRYSREQTESTLPGQTPAQKNVVPKGWLDARFDPEPGRLLSLSGTESQDTIVNDKNVAHAAITLHMSRVSFQHLSEEELASLQHLGTALSGTGSRLPLYKKPSSQEVQSSIQRTQLGSDTVDSLLEQLRAVEARGEKSDQTQLYLKFKALVYLHPQLCKQLGTILSTADPQSPTFVIIARALGSVNNSQAQEALVSAINARPGDLVAIGNLVPTLAQAPLPTLRAEETIRNLSSGSPDSNIAATALLSLGTMAHGLARSSPARSQRIVRDLLHQATLPIKEDRIHDVIEALGNSQSALALPALAGFAKSNSARLRAAAMDALRFMPGPRADELLLSGLEDPDAAPRLEAAYALGFRKITAPSFGMQKKALGVETDEKVRAALLTNLWKAHAKFPEAKPLVEKAAEQDSSEYVRKVAKGMLLESP